MKSVRQQRKSGEMGSQQQESAKKRGQIFYPLSKALDCPKREDKKKMPAQVFACKIDKRIRLRKCRIKRYNARQR